MSCLLKINKTARPPNMRLHDCKYTWNQTLLNALPDCVFVPFKYGWICELCHQTWPICVNSVEFIPFFWCWMLHTITPQIGITRHRFESASPLWIAVNWIYSVINHWILNGRLEAFSHYRAQPAKFVTKQQIKRYFRVRIGTPRLIYVDSDQAIRMSHQATCRCFLCIDPWILRNNGDQKSHVW